MLIFLYGLLIFLVYFLFPLESWAWGPGAHMTYALHALSKVAVLAPAIGALLKKHSNIFLYGTIAADIIFGKKYAGDLYHCHHWDVALPLLNKTHTDQERAFIYGYLGHLAVDTVAHNFYVPYKIIASFETRTLRHTYWEMRFDEKMDPKVWQKLTEVAESEYGEFDNFLEKNLKRTIFGFKTNKKIFNSLLLIQRMNKWQRASGLLARRSAYPLLQREVKAFRDKCFEVLIEFFQEPTKARVLKADPSGQLKLLYAKELVRDLRNYSRRKLISKPRAHKFVREVRDRLEEGLYQPVDLPLITDALH